jgi:CelD/BcsL family acetyltransferase involved in cellulose biosynthesis
VAVSTGIEVDLLDSSEAFAALDGWDDLVLGARRPSPYLLHGWLTEWWKHHGHKGTLSVVVARDGQGTLLAALPLFVRNSSGLRILEFLGGSQSALADLLLSPAAPPELPARLAERMRAIQADYVRLFGLPRDSPLTDDRLGSGLVVIERVESPILDMADGWEATYRRKTTAKKRNHHARRRRQLAELGELRIEVARNEADLCGALEQCFRLHELRWQGRPDGSGFATPLGRAFQRAAIRRMAALDAARIVTLRIGEQTVAFHYFFLLQRTMYVHRLAFDPAFSKFSPGLVNTLDALAAASADGAERVEYLGGDERYKLELADTSEPLLEAIGLPASLRGRGAALAATSVIRVRKRLKHHRRVRRFYFERLAPCREAVRHVRGRGGR